MKLLIITYCFLLGFTNLNAQISGCTDPKATNFNPSATVNDGSCTYNSYPVAPTFSTNLDANLSETSGLIKWGNYIFTHNDDTDINLYALDTLTGIIQHTYKLTGSYNNDWEEISQDSDYIYIGDFGNNSNGNRTDLNILRIDKNSLLKYKPIIDTINFSYSDQKDFAPAGSNNTDFDCEAFIVSSDSIYLFTKQWISNKATVYALSKTPGNHIANPGASYNVEGLITGATYLESKRLVVLCGYSSLLQPFLYLLYDFNGNDFFSGNKRKVQISLAFHQIEGIATSDGLKYYLSNEHFTKSPLIDNPQKLHTIDLSALLDIYIDKINDIFDPFPQKDVQFYPNPINDSISLIVSKSLLPQVYKITNLSGNCLLNGKITTEQFIINTGELSAGVYLLRIGEFDKYNFKLIKK